ncbi:MAG: putative toxin-antitoxin system toxin component, PIN family [Nitrospirota bacterium]|nr:putative toxin-antitoxin system toxin component, PIN family [Nitrospirota bacterium]
MKAVLDTNVIIAAFASRGLCAELFEVCLVDHTIVISEHILSEIQKKLIEKIHLPQSTDQNIIDYLRSIAEIFEPEHVESVCRDKDDNKIIGTALAGSARFIITGDGDLLSLKKYKGVRIINPREYWSLLRKRG